MCERALLTYGLAEARKDLLATYRTSELQFEVFYYPSGQPEPQTIYPKNFGNDNFPVYELTLGIAIVFLHRAWYWAQLSRIGLSRPVPETSWFGNDSANLRPLLHEYFECELLKETPTAPHHKKRFLKWNPVDHLPVILQKGDTTENTPTKADSTFSDADNLYQ